ncbi:hypothetical protein [Pseudofrankia sp. DC12]|uniref:hypothetical protein n=1 Tax=Pseudofrankia sp. DC12 TaxID=683315 RepID=UPI0018DE167F|nr:hypothetical protein [Pseudofrankia sp. DC12]
MRWYAASGRDDSAGSDGCVLSATRFLRSASQARTRPRSRGDSWLRGALGEAASSAARSKTTYLSAHYRRIATRRGSKRALVAVSHTMLVIAWHLLHDQTTYRGLGPDYYQRRQDPDRQTRKLVHQLQQLGHQVTLTASP